MNNESIAKGDISLGIELGSTRIKAVIINEKQQILASGDYEWENQLKNGYWTYDLTEIWKGLQGAYASLKESVVKKYDLPLKKIKNIGISAMMHGYLPLDEKDQLLVPFRTWRNTTAGVAAKELTRLFSFNIPERWSIAHLYQAILDQEEHVKDIRFLTTLSGYLHYQLTGKKVLGVGDASGMFPIDPKTKDYYDDMLQKFQGHITKNHFSWEIKDLLPTVLSAGEDAGKLTEKGAKLLDPTGDLEPGSKMAPPEGDAGTGMVATNSIKERTGNVSAGTSIFAMIVLEKALQGVYPEIDVVATPAGSTVAMVHANNFTSEINAWMKLFKEVVTTVGGKVSTQELFEKIFPLVLQGDFNSGDLLSYGYYSGESITQVTEGRPLFIRTPNSQFNLSNFIKAQLYGAFATLKIGMDILEKHENLAMDKIYGHGGIFKTPVVAQTILSAALKTPVTVMETAGEGGSYGMALLADYLNHPEKTLPDYLEEYVFSKQQEQTLSATTEEIASFNYYTENFKKGIEVEKAAIKAVKDSI